LVLGIALLSGCQSTVQGHPVAGPQSQTPTEPTFPTTRPSRPTPAPPTAATPTPQPTPGAQVLSPQNGYVFIETKSGKTRCQINEAEVGCESEFTNSPVIDGSPANGVRLSADGRLTWLVGNLGAIPAVTLDYRTYSALGWTIDAREDGTRFTNGTGHGMTVAVDGVQAF
jgi:hypothetical protein